ncbi:hypothetical protein GLYMA_01G239350v4 [Glycine max]|nr:hypothetical protein GLYMA_01G239350v4 [Glycine max]KAH1164466.1 hypothetical protein GYH30_002478 [Glycine max]
MMMAKIDFKIRSIRLVMLHHTLRVSLWNVRNNVIFREGACDFGVIVDSIKRISWQWLLYKRRIHLGISHSSWCLNPLGCL